MINIGVMAAFHKSAFDKLSSTPIDECQTCLVQPAEREKKSNFALFGSGAISL